MREGIATAILALSVLGAGCGGTQKTGDVMVFAAASLREVAVDLAAAFERDHGRRVRFNFAGSNTLAQQIRAAPRVDVFLSADEDWIRFVEDRGDAVPGSRRVFLANGLVAIRHRDSALRLNGPADLATAPFRHLALGDPSAVPAGRYARAYLERSSNGLWAAVADRVVPALDVRAALALVASDPEILGIVYRTDVKASDRVRILFEFAPRDDLPIVHWAVAIRQDESPRAGLEFLQFLERPEAREIALRHGFAAAAG